MKFEFPGRYRYLSKRSVFIISIALMLFSVSGIWCVTKPDTSTRELWILQLMDQDGEREVDSLFLKRDERFEMPKPALVFSDNEQVAIFHHGIKGGSQSLQKYEQLADVVEEVGSFNKAIPVNVRKFSACIKMSKKMGEPLCNCEFLITETDFSTAQIIGMEYIDVEDLRYKLIKSYYDKEMVEWNDNEAHDFYTFISDIDIVPIYTFIDEEAGEFYEIFGNVDNIKTAIRVLRKFKHE